MPADSGTQTVTLKFFDAANTGLVNTRFKDIRETGVYSGGYLSVVDASHCLLSTFVAEVTDGTYQVKVSTASAVNIAVALATPYVVIRWLYTGSASLDYASLIAVATPAANDVVVGKCSFSGSTLIGFDYGDTTYPRTTPQTHALHLNVEPTVDTELRVRVRAGIIQGFGAATFVPDQLSNLFVVPVSDSRIDLLYVDPDTGAVAIDASGTADPSPVPPSYAGKIVLAEITLASTSTNITASMIRDTRSFLSRAVEPDGSTLDFNGTTGLLERINPGTPYPGFGAKTLLDSLGSTLVVTTLYRASGDGFLSGYLSYNGPTCTVYTSSVQPFVAADIRQYIRSGNADGADPSVPFYTDVAANDYVQVVGAVDKIYWRPVGSGQLVVQ